MVYRYIAFLLGICLSGAVYAGDINQYAVVNTDRVTAAYDVFSEVAVFEFSHNIRTTGEAISEVLTHAGYRLADASASDPYIKHLLDSPLPTLHRSIGPAAVIDILDALSGAGWTVVRDPVHRLVSFEIVEDFRPCGYVTGGKGCP
ncbi:MAG TPA: hypothetical protein EYP41_03495 [Anaerolineae bacterium]|nr:hypothetical protein [Anaerolineae bacterium]